MKTRRRIYEGKAKILYEGPEPGTLVQFFKDDATAVNNQKKATITGKGVINNRISEYLMLRLAEIGVPTHFIRRLNMREQLIREVEIIPLEVVVRSIAEPSADIAHGFGGHELILKDGTVIHGLILADADPVPMSPLTDQLLATPARSVADEPDELLALRIRSAQQRVERDEQIEIDAGHIDRFGHFRRAPSLRRRWCRATTYARDPDRSADASRSRRSPRHQA